MPVTIAPVGVELCILHQVQVQTQGACLSAAYCVAIWVGDRQRLKAAAVTGQQHAHRTHRSIYCHRVGLGRLGRRRGELISHTVRGAGNIVQADLHGVAGSLILQTNRGVGSSLGHRVVQVANFAGL